MCVLLARSHCLSLLRLVHNLGEGKETGEALAFESLSTAATASEQVNELHVRTKLTAA